MNITSNKHTHDCDCGATRTKLNKQRASEMKENTTKKSKLYKDFCMWNKQEESYKDICFFLFLSALLATFFLSFFLMIFYFLKLFFFVFSGLFVRFSSQHSIN